MRDARQWFLDWNILKENTSAGHFLAHLVQLAMRAFYLLKINKLLKEFLFLHLLYLWSTEESAVHPICCDSSPNSTVTCQEIPQILLTLLTETPCFYLFGQPLLILLLPHTNFFSACLYVLLCELYAAHYSANYSEDTQAGRKASHNQFLLFKPQVKNRNARQDKRYEHE